MKNPMPPLTVAEFDALKESIREYGIIEPIVVDENGAIIDGHNRAAIAEQLEIELPKRVVPGLSTPEKMQYARTLNAARRQLSRAARKAIAVELHEEGFSFRQIALAIGVAHTTVSRWFEPKQEPAEIVTDATGGANAPDHDFRLAVPLDVFSEWEAQAANHNVDVTTWATGILNEAVAVSRKGLL